MNIEPRYLLTQMTGVGVIFLALMFLSSCVHKKDVRETSTSSGVNRLVYDQFKKAKVQEPIELKLKAQLGQVEKTKFNSASITEVFENSSLTSTREESVDFTAKNEIVKIISPDAFVERVTTSNKDGQIDLHDFAMPEPGEELMITIDSQAKILKVENFAANTLYYIPPISLPKDKASVGETWTMDSHWVTEQGVPLSLKLLSILKGYVECGEKDVCADLELSGEVGIDAKLGVRFESLWKGRVFFALGRGSIIWSLIESHEAWDAEHVHREGRSCLESALVDPPQWNIWKDEKPKCTVPRPLKD